MSDAVVEGLRTESDTSNEMYDQAATMSFEDGIAAPEASEVPSGGGAESPSVEGATDAEATVSGPQIAGNDGRTRSPDRDRSKRSRAGGGAFRPGAGEERAEIFHMGKQSMIRIEQLRAENIELKAECHRVRQEMLRLRERTGVLERIHTQLAESMTEPI